MTTTPGTTATTEAELTAIETDYPGWHAWISDIGRWYATRQGPAGRWMSGSGNPVTLDAETPAELRGQLGAAAARAEIAAARSGTGA